MITTLLAGLLIGTGVHIGSGCTSGHGISGIGRLSLRSMASVGVFMAAGLVISGMTQPHKVLGSLDFTGNWDPSLIFVVGGDGCVYAALSPDFKE